jgi:peptidoglycan-associated lipoprotein
MMVFKFGGGAAKWLGCGGVALLVAACGSTQAPPARQAPDVAEASSPDAQHDMAGRNDNDTTIQISDEFRRECQLPNAPQEAPHFDYAESTLRTHGRNVLDDVAVCLSEGALKGRVMTIIGRTDARGSAGYNKQLSANRAEAARNYLVQRGVPVANVRIVAQGKQGAQGNDEASWALDRRVDFELGDRTADAAPSPILEGTRIDGLSPAAPKTKGASYSDTAEGGKEVAAGSGAAGSGKASAGK